MGRLIKKQSREEKLKKQSKKLAKEQNKNSSTSGVKKVAVNELKPQKSKDSFLKSNFFLAKGVSFIRESFRELKRVVWPSKKQTITSTVFVTVLVIILSVFLGIMDFALSSLVRLFI